MSRGAVAALIQDRERLSVAAEAAGLVLDECSVESLPCVLTNMTTEELARVRFASGSSIIVKIAQSPRHSPLWQEIPPRFRDEVMRELPWRAETEIYGSELASLLPVGMYMPTLYAISELDEDRVSLWMEDIDERVGDWTASDYLTAARSLGRLAGRLPEGRIPLNVPVQRRDLRNYFYGRVLHGTLPTLLDDATWSHPLIRDVVDVQLRHDLGALAKATPGLLDRLGTLPYTFAHGDACPQNLLRPRRDTNAVVAIDWTFAGICPIGTDAGQLLAGRAESGELAPEELPSLFEAIVGAYIAGLADEGSAISSADARFGAIGNLVVRSAFTALPIELLGSGDPRVAELFARRARYARFLVDAANELLTTR